MEKTVSISVVSFILTIFVPLSLGYLLSYLYRTINAALAPHLMEAFGFDASALGVLTSSYLFAFALMQVPLGLLIDRYGVRWVQGINLLVAALGAVIFALADDLGLLMLGRALIGAGVAVSLMSSFASFIIWLPPQRVPMAMGFLMAFGGLGAVLAGAPVEATIQWIGWRNSFLLLAALTVLVALLVLLVLPDRKRQVRTSWSSLLAGLALVYRTPLFWRVVPLAIFTCGTGFALQGLWAGLWLSDVAGLGQDAVALHLSAIALGLLVGSIACGPMAALAARFGLSLLGLVGLLAAVFLVILAALALGFVKFALPLWVLVGFLINPLSLSYVALAQSFESEMAGRANTAVNLLVVLGSFAIQASLGWVLDLWDRPDGIHYPLEAYGVGFGSLALIGVATLVWFLLGLSGQKGRSGADRVGV
ncbi:MAG: MFS transporter [Kiloniellales bacterium]